MPGRDSRSLRVDIDGDPRGFDQAARQAQAAAGAFDKELEKLERTERKVERQNERNAAAMRRLEKAQKEAAEAAGRLERGEIDAAEAARLQERAENQLNKVLTAQAAASRAAAAAADKLAEEQREAARAATLAAATQRLAQLKAAGSVKEHDALVRQLRLRFGDLGKDGGKAFTEIGGHASKAGALLSRLSNVLVTRLGGGGLAAVAVGLAALPFAASVAAGAITLGVGGALLGIGILGAAQSKKVQKAFSDLGRHVAAESKKMSAPFEDTLVKSAGFFEDAFDELAPTLRKSLGELAPVATQFAHSLARSLTEFGPAIEDVTAALGPLVGELGDKLPGLMGRIADTIARIARSADPETFGQFIDGIGLTITAAGHLIATLSKLADAFTNLLPGTILGKKLDDFNRGLQNLTDGWFGASKGASQFQRDLNSTRVGTGLATAATGLLASRTGTASGQFSSMTGTMRLASQTATELKASLDALSGKTLSLREATSAYEAAVDTATDVIKQNGRAHGFATEKGRANEAALDAIAKSAQNEAIAMRGSDKSAADVARRMEEARRTFIATARQMGYTRGEAKTLADKMFGLRDAANAVPKSRQTKFSTPGVGDAIRASKDMRAAVRSVPTTWDTYFRTHHIGDAIRASKQMRHGGYIDGYAGGGEIRGYPSGGLIGGVGGPTADANLIAASRGEFMVNAASTAQFRPLLEAINAGRVSPKSMAYGPAMSHSPAAVGGPISVTVFIGGKQLGEIVIDPLRKAVKSRGGVEAAFS